MLFTASKTLEKTDVLGRNTFVGGCGLIGGIIKSDRQLKNWQLHNNLGV